MPYMLSKYFIEINGSIGNAQIFGQSEDKPRFADKLANVTST